MQFALTFLAFGAIGYWLDGKLGTIAVAAFDRDCAGRDGGLHLPGAQGATRPRFRPQGARVTRKSMKLFTIGNLLALAAACALAWRLGGALGWGVLAGFASGASLSAAGVCWQQALLRRGSSFVMQAFGLSFLVKLIVVVGGTLLLRFADGAEGIGGIGALVDWRSFLIAFPIAVLCVSSLGSIGTLRVLRAGPA